MKFSYLEKKDRDYVNGKVSQFMDAYVRQHQVWAPDQMLVGFVNKITSDTLNYNPINTWLTTDDGKLFAFEKMQKKYSKDIVIAKQISPIIQRVRFGFSWEESNSFDITFGKNNNKLNISTTELGKLPYQPWTVNHVNQQLIGLYNKKLVDTFEPLCKSPIEIQFYKYWIENYYENNSPALIPEVCGLDLHFLYYVYQGKAFATANEISLSAGNSTNIKPIKFRFDFFVSNPKNKKAAFIELDGHENHKTKEQRIIDSIKRNAAAEMNIPVIVFTGTQITTDIKACFNSMKELLKI